MADFIRSPVFQLKCAELLLSLVAVLSMLGGVLPSITSVILTEIVHFSLYGWLMLDILIVAGFFIREPVSKFLILVVSLTGTLFAFVSAVVLFVGWSNQLHSTRLLVAAIVTLFNTLVYAGDSFYIIRFAAD